MIIVLKRSFPILSFSLRFYWNCWFFLSIALINKTKSISSKMPLIWLCACFTQSMNLFCLVVIRQFNHTLLLWRLILYLNAIQKFFEVFTHANEMLRGSTEPLDTAQISSCPFQKKNVERNTGETNNVITQSEKATRLSKNRAENLIQISRMNRWFADTKKLWLLS